VIAVLFILLPSAAMSAGFEEGLNKILNDRCAKTAKVSMTIKSLGTGNTIYAKNPDQLMVPASNMKVVTSIAAMEILRPDFIFKTAFSYTGKRVGDTIEGDLIISGGGDPHIVIEDMYLMVNEIRKRGIKLIKGNLILDESYFESGRVPAGWHPSNQRRAYEAPIGALAFNFNSFAINIYPADNPEGETVVSIDPDTPYFKISNKIKVVNKGRSKVTLDYKRGPGGMGETIIIGGKVKAGLTEKTFYRAVKHPAEYFGTTFIHFLSNSGIKLEGSISSAIPHEEKTFLFDYKSKPLITQIAYMNKFSNNFMAENILRTIAAEKVSIPGEREKGIRVVQDLLASFGISENRFRVYDGSGFAKENRLSSMLIVDLLEHAYKDWEYGPEFISSLALMGRDGSVEERMAATDKTIRVKTGTLKNISALSGYYPLDSGDIIAFSMIFNDLPCDNGEVWNIQHRILREFDKIDVY
jgi:D-alanyl-D-alanine carboxypeptidase/D-alanyl-D-alanine-endopeptidase (penicillin-binding protein 4)